MNVRAIQVYVDGTGKRRERICRRDDGRYQFVTETLIEESDECQAYWNNDYPPSGLYSNLEDVIEALTARLSRATRLSGVEGVDFELNVGPYPDPSFID